MKKKKYRTKIELENLSNLIMILSIILGAIGFFILFSIINMNANNSEYLCLLNGNCHCLGSCPTSYVNLFQEIASTQFLIILQYIGIGGFLGFIVGLIIKEIIT